MDGDGAVRAETTTLEVGEDRRGREVDVQCYTAGSGDPVVLLHGCGLDAATVSYRYLLPELAEDHRVHAIDFPGHGHSDKPSTRYTTAFFRRVLRAYLAELGVESPSLVGISMGGSVALGHALDHDVDRLVLVDSYGLGGDAHWRPAASVGLRIPLVHRGWWRSLGSSQATVRGHLRSVTAGTPPEDLVEDVYAAVQDDAVGRTVRSWQRSEFRASGLQTDYHDRLAGLETETLLVHGESDPLLPASWSERAADLLPNAQLEVYERTGHWPPRERPERFNADVTGFLA
ncbi:alpha/beta fold hydrolase [Salinirubellus sp. GCM10025818]|uniref:alpha/beta fold hydrolase n=1 Tax=Salinirubellus TaxID=2162630 RepID=UPI0030D44F3F